MNSAGEEFVLQLARASRKANFLLRKLGRADREDVLAEALAWCWKNRDSYSITATLDTWFVGAVRNALAAWRRGETRQAATAISDIPTGDTTFAVAATQSAVEALLRGLPPEYKQVAKMEQMGMTRIEMMNAGTSKAVIDAARARIKQLRKLVPNDSEYRRVLRAGHVDGDGEKQPRHSSIDKEIQALEFAPPAGRDCPPCWRCKWFEGYMPGSNKILRMPITERSVKAAVLWTERRKIRIAQEVRDGNL
jgi:hypothetical protein